MLRSSDVFFICRPLLCALLLALPLAACGTQPAATNSPSSTGDATVDSTAESATTAGSPTTATEAHSPPASRGTVKTGTFYSEALGVDKNYYVYLPAGYDRNDKRYPVLYYLHGLTGWEAN